MQIKSKHTLPGPPSSNDEAVGICNRKTLSGQKANTFKELYGGVKLIPKHPEKHNLPSAGSLKFGKYPTNLICPYCYQCTETHVKRKFSAYQHSLAVLLCTTGCFILGWLPYCHSSLKNCCHYCKKCKKHLGTFYRCE